jgi:carboxypeptidase A4
VGWGGGGSSPTPSSETFSGFAPHDTPETAALAAYAGKLRDLHGIKLYVDWHSYAQVILLSYGYTCTEFPANFDEQNTLAAGISAAIAKPYNTTFDYGSGCCEYIL